MKTKPIYLLLNALIALACVGGIYNLLQKPGLKVLLYYRNQQVVVRSLDVDTSATLLRKGDVLQSINKQPVTRVEEVEYLLDPLAIGQQVQVGIIRAGKPLQLQITLQRYNRNFYLLVLLIVCPVFLLLGLLVISKRPVDDSAALIFHWFSAAIALYVSSTFGHYAQLFFISPILFRGLHFLTVALTPVLFLHFSLLFPVRDLNLKRKWLAMFYLGAVLFSVLAGYYFNLAMAQGGSETFGQFLRVYNLGRLLFAFAAIAGLLVFIQSYRSAQQESERRQLRWILLGLTITIAGFTGLWQLPQVLGFTPLVRGEAILLSILAIPVTFTVAVVRYHLLNIDLVFKRSTVYFIVINTILILYTLLISLTALLTGQLTVRASLTVSAMAAVLVGLLFEPLRRRVQLWVDKRFFRQQYDYRLAQREFSYAVNQYFDVSGLMQFVVDKLDSLIQPNYTAVYTFREGDNCYSLDAAVNLSDPEPALEMHLDDLQLYNVDLAMGLDNTVEQGVRHLPGERATMEQYGVGLIIPFNLGPLNKPDLLVLGTKKSGRPYSMEDVDFLVVAVRQLAAVLKRIRMQHKLLQQAAETKRLQELNKLKSLFVSSVSHDLRTPLTSIRMFAELLRDETKLSGGTRAEYLDIIEGEGQRLERLIDNILDYAQLEQSGVVLKKQQIDLRGVVHKTLQVMRYPLESHHIELKIDMPAGPVWIEADPDAMMQVLTNLVDNAIKYGGDHKAIFITLQNKEDSVFLKITDQGPGLPEHEIASVFQPFYRIRAESSSAGGTGLGLAVVKQIVEAHQATVQAENSPGQGAMFMIRLAGGTGK